MVSLSSQQVYDHRWWRTNAQDAVWPTVEAVLEGWSISPGANWQRSERQGRSHSFIHLVIQDVHTYIHAHTHRAIHVPVKVLGFRDIMLSRLNRVPELTIE